LSVLLTLSGLTMVKCGLSLPSSPHTAWTNTSWGTGSKCQYPMLDSTHQVQTKDTK
jgi:hypothetical protein